MIHERHMEWIEARGIDPELASKLGLTSHRDEHGFWLSVPYVERGQVVNHKYRQTTAKRHKMDGGAPLCLWNHDILLDAKVQSGAQQVIITEGEWDALAAMTAGLPFVLSVPNGAPAQATEGPIDPENDADRFAYLWRSRDLLDKVGQFIIATDGDEPGRILAAELVRRLGAERCKFVEYPEGCKDLNDVLLKHGARGLVHVVGAAKAYPVRGLYAMNDFPDPAPVTAIHIRMPGIHDMFPVVPGTFSVITGYAGQGKTSLLMVMLADLLKQGVNIALGSFETAVKPILQNRLRAALIRCPESTLPAGMIAGADALIDARLRLIAQQPHDDDADMALEDVLELARIAVLRDGVKLVVLDPWNELEHKRRPDETETDYTGRAIRMLKRFARQYDVAVWLVAHPRKPDMTGGNRKAPTLYDISGSANFANKADYGVVVHRPTKDGTMVDVHVVKVRMGLPGRQDAVRLDYQWHSSSYTQMLEPSEQVAA